MSSSSSDTPTDTDVGAGATDEETTRCPTCDKPFDTRKGMKIHHANEHGERIVDTKTCEVCDEEFEPWRPTSVAKYCSDACKGKGMAETVTLTCPGCEEEFDAYPHENNNRDYCSWRCRISCLGAHTRGCPICRAVFESEEEARYCGPRCQEIANELETRPYHPRRPHDSDSFERLVDHCYFKQGFDIDATTRIVHHRLDDGKRWTRDDVEELTGEMLERQRKVDQRLCAIRPEDIGLSPLGDRTASGEGGDLDEAGDDTDKSVTGNDAIGLMGVGR